MKTKSMLLAPFAVAILSYGAFAADLPRQRDVGYTAPPAPVATWTGYYIGGNIGYGWGRTENDATVVGLPPVLFGLSTASLARGDRDRQDINGVIGGFQSGYNWQAGSWVMGLESDLQASGQKSDALYCNLGGTTCAVASLSASHKLSWFGTARSRIGFLFTPGTLIYGTGGVAYGQVKSDYNFTLGGVPFASANFKDVKAGWTAGAGVEFAFASNWSAKLEYLYIDLGDSEVTVNVAGVGARVQRSFTEHVGRLGLNYRFDRGGLFF
ncbi:MAG TPA: outer membrane protein [Pyrinomonadaceae bacterium]|jgi:outer membrane immunogenic protein|nr:outer membrane protein [Pyrinomonadaceae bacterium]